ncbi:unnamed protein product [marine sediment metagenome]|uniref:Uncharacterized protein n=1 Tax=marine sediment metagenome TaxID=412755 RepID=X1C943_9ZZZZ
MQYYFPEKLENEGRKIKEIAEDLEITSRQMKFLLEKAKKKMLKN